ncbi:MAG: pantoate--beta-alanine ligase [Proteobacteria bacterium]|nr:pantoate--beta-alanine ligase [Pseudomonadota bacterium]
MRLVKTIKEMQSLSEELRKEKRIGLVPTMGYLHEGHLSLVKMARRLIDVVVVSIFVNPAQFGPKEDFSKYPRDLQRDMKLLEKEHTDIVFFPEDKDMYPEGYSTYIQVKGLEDYLCGKTRAGHFVGVATVVAKLLNIVKPHLAVFGQKDYQQIRVIQRMVKDLNMDIEIIPHPTLREKDGLAMSSRNTYLSPTERERALLIYRAIKKVEEIFKEGQRGAPVLKEKVKRVLSSKNGIDIKYISICNTDTLEEVDQIKDKALLAIACRIGRTRLIDNTILMEA